MFDKYFLIKIFFFQVPDATGEDHDYTKKNKRRSTQNDKENAMYKETIKELKIIRQELGDTNKNLNNINNTLQELKNIFLQKFS